MKGTIFINNSLSGVSRMTQSQSLRLPIHRPMAVAVINRNGRPERSAGVSVDNAPMVVEVVDPNLKEHCTVVDGAFDDDIATDDDFVTPLSVSVASGYSLLRNPCHNKGLAFTEKERDAHYIRGLLPPVVVKQDLQVKKMMNDLRLYEVSLHKYQAMMDLQERNEKLFYKLLVENFEELLPIVYTPTVGEACQKYGSILKRPQGGRFLRF